MRRLLRIRLVLVLFGLVLAPAAVLPFAAQLRSEWAKFWEPRPEVSDEEVMETFYLPPGEWCGTFPGSVMEDPIVIGDVMTESVLPSDSAFGETNPEFILSPLVVEP